MESIEKILQELNKSKITSEQALVEINAIKHKPAVITTEAIKPARKIKISVNTYDKEEDKNTKINLPGISFKFATGILGFILKHAGDKVQNDSFDFSDKQNIEMIKKLIKALADMPPFEIVTVNSDDTNVHIYTY